MSGYDIFRGLKDAMEKVVLLPWFLWFGGLSAGLGTERSLVQFSVRAHAWVSGQVPVWKCARGSQLMFLSHIDVYLPLSLSD